MLDSIMPGDYWFARFLLQRALGVIYLLAFTNALNQFPALAGEKGLLPVPHFIRNISFRRSPSLFHWHYSDLFFRCVAWAGILLSLLAITGLTDGGPIWVSMIPWFLLWVLYMSIVNTGQLFYGFGWESMLLEAGFFAIFLGPSSMAVPLPLIWIYCWMLFRVEFGAGLIKMRGDRCWRNLTCMNYHHETQPLPNPLSRYFHMLPEPLHKVETLFNHFVQLIAVWGLFLPQPIASVSALLIILSQGYLIISGNYAWLNWLTLSLGFSAIGDGFIQSWLGLQPPATEAIPPYFLFGVGGVTLLVIYLSINPIRNMISPHQRMNFSFNPLHLVNTYGAFGTVTQTRYEIVVEGTNGDPDHPDTEWEAYHFKAKPTDPGRRPPQISPYHLRLDWQIWFTAMSAFPRRPWFKRFIQKLLEGDEKITGLLRHNPFPDDPPSHIRSLRYRYRYTDRHERKMTGQWWKRELVHEFTPPRQRKS